MNPAEIEKQRRLPIGAEIIGEGTHFRVWTPSIRDARLVLEEDRELPMQRNEEGYCTAYVEGIGAGALYRFRLDGGDYLYPDPASRFQPDGPHGPSQVVGPAAYRWQDHDWTGLTMAGQVIYEMHIGTFTREGTWAAAAEQLEELRDLGITLLEIMPVADFPGRFGWGYDGVDFFAPTRLYGQPDDFRRFVDRAHQVGLGVSLDVVYNHGGPDGNYLHCFSRHYFTRKYKNEWGDAFNFDDRHSDPVREFFISNARYWISEFHLDGFRLDATQSMIDHSEPHIIADLVAAAREAAGKRKILIIGENEPQQTHLLQPAESGGEGLDGLWNDDFHHSAVVALTGRDEAYYSDYRGAPQEFISAAKWAYLYQGQYYQWQKKGRGTPTLGIDPCRFINFIENHDQVANSLDGHRSHQYTSPARHRAMTALMLLLPGTPMLFQGQEFSSSSPFLYFADHKNELAEMVRKGRHEFLQQFPSIASPEVSDRLADPFDPGTFKRCKLDFSERKKHRPAYTLHRDLLRLRREDPVFSAQAIKGLDGAVLGMGAFALRFFGPDWEDRLMLVNFGVSMHLIPVPEPLLAPPPGKAWAVLWTSETLAYGGLGMPPLKMEANWTIPGEAAVVLHPVDPA